MAKNIEEQLMVYLRKVDLEKLGHYFEKVSGLSV
jgi:hypothetical protein